MSVTKKKEIALAKIAEEITKCKTCKIGTIGLAVPGEGSAEADIVFIGEAPGKNEAKTGKPFIGRAGKILRQGLASIGLKDQDVYITSPVKYLPVQGTPSLSQIEHGKIHLFAQLEIIKPKVIVLLGRVAVLAVLNEVVAMTQVHGKTSKQDGSTYFLMLHPAAPLYSPKLLVEFMKDFKGLKRILNTR